MKFHGGDPVLAAAAALPTIPATGRKLRDAVGGSHHFCCEAHAAAAPAVAADAALGAAVTLRQARARDVGFDQPRHLLCELGRALCGLQLGDQPPSAAEPVNVDEQLQRPPQERARRVGDREQLLRAVGPSAARCDAI